MNKYLLFFILSLVLFSCTNSEKMSDGSEITVENAWVRQTPPASDVTALYMDIQNKTKTDDTVINVSSDCADRSEIHTTYRTDEDLIRMKRVERIVIETGKTHQLKPEGDHIMLFGVKCDLSEMEKIPFTLTFEKKGQLKLDAVVKKMGSNSSKSDDHNHH